MLNAEIEIYHDVLVDTVSRMFPLQKPYTKIISAYFQCSYKHKSDSNHSETYIYIVSYNYISIQLSKFVDEVIHPQISKSETKAVKIFYAEEINLVMY